MLRNKGRSSSSILDWEINLDTLEAFAEFLIKLFCALILILDPEGKIKLMM